MDAIEAALYSATEEALATLGEPTLHAFLWQLHHDRIPYSQEAMDMAHIESKLRQFFGVASPVIIQLIYEKFMLRVLHEGYFSEEMISMLDKLPKNSNTDTILRLVSQHRKSH